jgi:hypothetical protein
MACFRGPSLTWKYLELYADAYVLLPVCYVYGGAGADAEDTLICSSISKGQFVNEHVDSHVSQPD